jgi:glucose/arabinose dehydrogenase
MRKLLFNTILIACTIPSFAQLNYTLDSTTLVIEVALDSNRVDIPWEILWGPDDRLWMTDANRIIRWDPITDQLDTLAERPYGNGLGMALHPDFPNTPVVVAVFDTSFYYAAGNLCELIRFEYDPIADVLINDTVLLEYPHFGEHSGGRVLFDSTETILLTTADYWLEDDTLDHKMGKVLRVALDGSVPPDNPTSDHTWTRGHRNPQGLTRLPNGNIIVSEHGMPSDELNLIQPGLNYGWPVWDGFGCTNIYPDSCLSSTYITEDPLTDFFTPPSGIEHYPYTAIPEFTDKAITCVLWQQGFSVFGFNSTYDQVMSIERWNGGAFNDLQRIRDIAIRPDGSFYLITNDRFDARIRHVRKDLSTALADMTISDLRIHPNPAQDFVRISSERTAVLHATPYLIDITGKVYPVPFTYADEHWQLDIRKLKAGLYTVVMEDLDQIQTARFAVIK